MNTNDSIKLSLEIIARQAKLQAEQARFDYYATEGLKLIEHIEAVKRRNRKLKKRMKG